VGKGNRWNLPIVMKRDTSIPVILARLLTEKKLYLPIAEQAMSSSFYRQQPNNITIAILWQLKLRQNYYEGRSINKFQTASFHQFLK